MKAAKLEATWKGPPPGNQDSGSARSGIQPRGSEHLWRRREFRARNHAAKDEPGMVFLEAECAVPGNRRVATSKRRGRRACRRGHGGGPGRCDARERERGRAALGALDRGNDAWRGGPGRSRLEPAAGGG